MFARACPRVFRSSALRTSISPCTSTRSVFHSSITAPLYRVERVPLMRCPWSPARRKASTRVAAKKLFKEHPFSMTLASAIILLGIGMLVYINYIYQSYIIGDFKAYPEPVAVKLRRALYYQNIDLQPKNSIKYYRQALQVAAELGMDPFSDEMLGVKFQLSKLFEQIQMYQRAIDVLELVRSDCLQWIKEVGGKPGNESRRREVLAKTIAISVRLGDCYSSEQINNQEAAEARLVWAVSALLKELKRREDEGVKEGEGDWMSTEEIGGTLEALGHHYEAKDQHHLCAPLFLQALSLCPPSSCHSVVLMNNLAISLAQQRPPPSLMPNQAPSSAASHLSDARQWGLKALALASSIKPPKRTEECDIACAVATSNLGDFALMDGDVAEARRRFEEGRSISKGIGFVQGVERADQSLEGLRKQNQDRL